MSSPSGRPARALALAAGVGTVALAARWLAARPRPGTPFLAGAPLLIAHRGGSALAPENTLLALERAVHWWGADLLELDVHPTRDGEVVVIHDATLQRTTDGSGAVAQHSLAQLQALDAGYRFSPDGGATFPFRGADVRIPTLAEVMERLPHARLIVEIKDGRAQQRVWEAVHAARATHRVLIAAGKQAGRARFDAYPGPLGAAEEELRSFYLHHRTRTTPLARLTVDAFQMPERHEGRQILSPRFVREAHARNVAVHVWTVDEEEDMHRLLEWGVDGVITDRPDRLARVLAARTGRPLPPGPPPGALPPSLERLLLG